MNSLEYYNRQKDSWEDNEIQQLKSEYEIKEMTISEIADIHHRTPGSISYKLKGIGIITHNTLARGYDNYRNSNLYKEIVEKGKTTDNEIEKKKESNNSSMKDFTMSGKPWSEKEDEQLIKEYTIDKLSLLEICKCHKRNAGGISSRLKHLKLIEAKNDARGYSEYLGSNLHKENLEKKEAIITMKNERKVNISPNSEISELKSEIISLKKDVKELLRLIHEIYDFETQ